MLHTAALPFVLRRDRDVINRDDTRGHEVMSTRDQLHGLLYLNGQQLIIQWRTSREVSRVGREIRTDRQLTPVREVALPLAALANASVRSVWRRWWFGEALVLTAADLTAFDALTGEGDSPGLVLEHPAEIVLEVRRTDRNTVREFVSELRLAISEHRLAASEHRLAAYEDQLQEQQLLGGELPLSEGSVAANESAVRARSERERS